MTESLFPPPTRDSSSAPLAERMRPETLQEVQGQRHLLAPGKFLLDVAESGSVPSMILWGPPGVGKTTLARLIAERSGCHFVSLSAVLSGIKDVKKVTAEADFQQRAHGRGTILFIDEIHRFNKAQQDAFLPHVEKGTIILIGATTENPSFEVISPLLSRTRVLVLEPLSQQDLEAILGRAVEAQNGLNRSADSVEEGALEHIAAFSDGDARIALNSLEAADHLARHKHPEGRLLLEHVAEALQRRTLRYDKAGEEHFNLISALQKSIRNSDVNASLYWLGRMLEAGEDPLYIARRMVRTASEDIGLADPGALGLAVDATRAVQFIGLPEGKLALAQLAVYLAQAPKSNSVYKAYGEVEKDVERTRNEPVPLHLRNAPTRLMKSLGYGKGYRYAHDEARHVSEMQCLPESLADRQYYHPSNQGDETRIAKRIREIAKKRESGSE